MNTTSKRTTHALLAAIAATTFACAAAASAADVNFDKTLTVKGSPVLTVSTGSGYIHISTGSDDQVHVVGHVHSGKGWFSGDAEARAKQLAANPPILQTGNIITIGQHNHSFQVVFHDLTVDYDITTPKSSTVKAETGSGDLQLANLDGAVTAQTGSGDVKAQNLGANAHLETGSGSIDAETIRGAATLETGSGDIRLSQAAAGDVKASTGSGSIRATGVDGGLKAETGSGDIEIAGKPTADWKLGSGSGSIRLAVGGAKFNLNAETASGTVHMDQPITMQGDVNRHHVRGTVNGGGPTIKAETGSGDITVK